MPGKTILNVKYTQTVENNNISYVVCIYTCGVAVGQYYYNYVLGLIKYSIYKTGLANKYISLVSAQQSVDIYCRLFYCV